VYEKAVFAAAKDWMKCCIVPNVEEMIRLATYIKEKNLPRFKIISSEILNSVSREIVELKGYDYIGNLADLVNSRVPNLVDFIFGNVYVVRNSKTAYQLSKQGYKCVTIAGELFEPHANTLSLDFGSKLSDLTREIILNESIGSLLKNSKILSSHLENMKAEWKKTNSEISNKEMHIVELEKLVAENSINSNHLREVSSGLVPEIEKIKSVNSSLSAEINEIETQLVRNKKRDSIISSSVAKYMTKLQTMVDDKVDNELSELTDKKSEVLRKIENSEIEHREIITSIKSLENEIASSTERKNEMSNEGENLQREKLERQDQNESASQRLEQLEKESIAIKKDISNFTAQENQAMNDLTWLGFKELLESEIIEVDILISELTREYDDLKTRLNLRAHETYVQVIDGYRDMYSRKIYLESERNSIVLFISEIDKEKKDVFMDAFKKVDEDIRKTLSDITGGAAYLQIENDDVFSGGLSYLVQFQGKPPR